MTHTPTTPARGPLGGAPALAPTGSEVASFATYAEAQFAVDSLSDSGFPVQNLTIVGTDLRQVERITGRMSWGRAAAAGAGSGLWIGMFFAAMMSLFNPEGASMALFASCVLLGVVWGMIFQLGSYALSRGRRDFTSISQVVASRYSIMARANAAEAARELAQVPGNLTRGGAAAQRAEQRRRARQEASEGAPSAFGSRPDEKPRYGVRLEPDHDLADLAGSGQEVATGQKNDAGGGGQAGAETTETAETAETAGTAEPPGTPQNPYDPYPRR